MLTNNSFVNTSLVLIWQYLAPKRYHRRGSTFEHASKDRNMALQGTQQAHTFQWQGRGAHREKLPYLLYLPADYDTLDLQPLKRWPLMLFLHGAGERGNSLKLVMRHGPPRLVKEGQQFQFIIVSPQCPKNECWTGKLAMLAALLDKIKNDYAVDPDRMYLTG